MLDTDNKFAAVEKGDVVFLQVSHKDGNVTACMERNGSVLYWAHETPVSIVRTGTETFKGIMCPEELKRALMFVARAFNLRGVEPHEPPEAFKKTGWVAFRFV